MRLLWLADVLRDAGLPVHEVSGWRERGRSVFYPRGIICHATAGSRTATDQGEINVLLNGSASAPPPIAQLYLSRTGTWHVVASGACNHALVGWAGPHRGFGNRELLGIEAANDNGRDVPRVPAEPWPAAQLNSYARGVAAICRRMNWSISRVAGPKEHQPAGYGQPSTKTDPTFDMPVFRGRVAQYLTAPPQPQEDVMNAVQAEQLSNLEKLRQALQAGDSHVRQVYVWSPAGGRYEDQPLGLYAAVAEKARPAGTVTLTEDAVAALEPVIERVVRRVLGGLDGASPPDA